jgi:hypothetical protein
MFKSRSGSYSGLDLSISNSTKKGPQISGETVVLMCYTRGLGGFFLMIKTKDKEFRNIVSSGWGGGEEADESGIERGT